MLVRTVGLFKYLARNVIFSGVMVMIVMTNGVGAGFNTQSQGDVVKTNFLINGQLYKFTETARCYSERPLKGSQITLVG